LENLIIKRGGLEGINKSEHKDYLNQQEFEVFFQQIKAFLTVQEQIDLFLELQKRGSLEAGFLAFLSLTAISFSRRKPEKLFEARRILKKLNLSGLDSMPLVGCLDLLLADIDQASANTFPYIKSQQPYSEIEHEASTCRISEDQLFYLQSRGIEFEEAVSMMVSGFCRDVFNQLPMEFAAEADKLLALILEGSVG